MFCPHCGKEIDNNASVCIGCGHSVTKLHNAPQDSSSAGWWWLGFFLPVVGFILWCVWTGSTPIKAKKSLWGAIFGIIASVVIPIILYILMCVLIFLGLSQSYISL